MRLWHPDAMTERRIGIVMWLMTAVPVLIQPQGDRWRLAAWAFAFVVFGTLYRFGRGVTPLVVESMAVVAMVLTRCNGFEGTLLVLVAMQLGARFAPRTGVTWIVIQTLLLGGAIAIHWSMRPALMLVPPYFGFQLLAFATIASMGRLAEATREVERLRISRDLHDALGHRLTALTLNLETALRREDSRENIERARSLAREILADVREIVEGARGEGDLAGGLERLIDSIPKPRVHLQVGSRLDIDDPQRRHVLLRTVQEIITNAARHSEAANLWIAIDRQDGELRIRARDDGRGAAGDESGFGLRGMRERVESSGGTLSFGSSPGQGFEVVASIPLSAT